jgi:hypothetical protein
MCAVLVLSDDYQNLYGGRLKAARTCVSLTLGVCPLYCIVNQQISVSWQGESRVDNCRLCLIDGIGLATLEASAAVCLRSSLFRAFTQCLLVVIKQPSNQPTPRNNSEERRSHFRRSVRSEKGKPCYETMAVCKFPCIND